MTIPIFEAEKSKFKEENGCCYRLYYWVQKFLLVEANKYKDKFKFLLTTTLTISKKVCYKSIQ